MTTGRRNRELGTYGEDVALRHLQGKGLVLVDRNWRCDSGELDLVLRADRTLVFCEVKTRVDESHGHPLEAVDDRKLARVRRLADLWIEAHGVRPDGIRIDLVGVLRPTRGPAVVEHVAGLVG